MGRRSPPRAPPPRLIKAIFSVWKRLINSVWKIGRRPHRCPNTRVIPKSNRQNCVGTFFLFDHPICVFVALYDLIFSAWPRGNFHNAIDRSIPSWNWANWMMMIFFFAHEKVPSLIDVCLKRRLMDCRLKGSFFWRFSYFWNMRFV